MHVPHERFDRGQVVDLRQHHVVRRRPDGGPDDPVAVLADGEVGRSSERPGVADQLGTDAEQQVVLGLAFGEERARLREERPHVRQPAHLDHGAKDTAGHPYTRTRER